MDILEKNLKDFCTITKASSDSVCAIIGGDRAQAEAILCQGWEVAYCEKTYRVKNEKFGNTEISYYVEGGGYKPKHIKVRIRLSDPKKGGKLPYYIYAVDNLCGDRREYDSLRKFAFVQTDSERNLYRELADRALPEPWSFSRRDGTEILQRYLNATFLHVLDEGKIVYESDSEGKMAVFNTGLVDSNFNDILCFCVPYKSNNDKLKWKVDSFCTKGSGHSGQRLQGIFGNRLPQRASYFSSVSDIAYDASLELVPDYDHLMQRLYRIEIPALKALCVDSFPAMAILREAESASKEGKSIKKNALKRLVDIVQVDPKLSSYIQHSLEEACKVAQSRARYMYSSALPAWNPKDFKGGQMYFCLPLCLLDQRKVDTVLITILQDSVRKPYYKGATLYTLRMTYEDSRAVQRIDGMTGWIAGAFSPQEEGKIVRHTSSFGFTPVTQPFEDDNVHDLPADTEEDRIDNESNIPDLALAILRSIDSNLSSEYCVHSDDTIGRNRRPEERQPNIVLPSDDTNFYLVSQLHGQFSYRHGVWRYEHWGKNPTKVFHKSDKVDILTNPGQTTIISFGDTLSFGDSPRFRFEA